MSLAYRLTPNKTAPAQKAVSAITSDTPTAIALSPASIESASTTGTATHSAAPSPTSAQPQTVRVRRLRCITPGVPEPKTEVHASSGRVYRSSAVMKAVDVDGSLTDGVGGVTDWGY